MKPTKPTQRFKWLCRAAMLALMVPAAANAQLLDNKGTEFILPFLPNFDASVEIELHLTSDTATNVTVEYPVGTPVFTDTVAVNPGAITVVPLPITAATGWTPNSIADNCVGAFSEDEFVCYMVNRRPFSSDAGLGLPVDVLNTNYIVLDYDPAFVGSEFVVAAVFDNTTVTITPAQNMSGRPAGVPFDVTLNRGEGYFGRSLTSSASNTLTGTLVEADRPVALVNGNGCTQVPNGTVFCDHIFEMAQPVQSWGNSALVANLPQRANGVFYRILASEDNTEVFQDGVSIGTINAAEFLEVGPLAGNHQFTADNPVFVAQYMTGSGFPGATEGDPAMGNMVPSEQYLSAYTFATVGNEQFDNHFLTIIAENGDVGSLLLDGAPVPAGDFTPIGGTGFSAAVIPLQEGTHTTSSNGFHGITVEGYNQDDSYIYPGGAKFQFINPQGDANPPICGCGFDDVNLVWNCTATDNRPSEDTNGNGILDEGEDLNGNGVIDEDTGIFFVALEPGAENLALVVDPFTPGDGEVTYSVEIVDPNLNAGGTVTVTDGAGNICQTELSFEVEKELAYKVFWTGDDAYFDTVLYVNGEPHPCPGWCADLEELIPLEKLFDGSAPDCPAPVLYSTLIDNAIPDIVDNPTNLPAINFLLNWYRGDKEGFQTQYPGAGWPEVQGAFWKLLFQGIQDVTPPAGFITWDDTLAAQIASDALTLTPEDYEPGEGDVVALVVYLGDDIQTTVKEVSYEFYQELLDCGLIQFPLLPSVPGSAAEDVVPDRRTGGYPADDNSIQLK